MSSIRSPHSQGGVALLLWTWPTRNTRDQNTVEVTPRDVPELLEQVTYFSVIAHRAKQPSGVPGDVHRVLPLIFGPSSCRYLLQVGVPID